jgi:alcohol dehydrogenase class IV
MYSTSFKVPYTVMGAGTVGNIGDIVGGFATTRVLVITDAGIVRAGLLEKIKASLDKQGCHYELYDGIRANAPSGDIEKCAEKVVKDGYGLLIGVGGGSVMDSTKMTSVIVANGVKVSDVISGASPITRALPKILVPTTAGTGSELSNVAMVTDESDGFKKLNHSTFFWADAVILDPEMSLNLPQHITAETGMDVLAHSIEAYASAQSNPVSDMFAETAIKLVAANFRRAYGKGNKHIEARYGMAVAASLGMKAAEIAGTGLGHFIDSLVVGKFHISHGAALTILLPHVCEFNLVAVPERYARVAAMLGEQTEGLTVIDAAGKAVAALRRLATDMGMKQRLSEAGMKESDIPPLVDDLFRLKAGPIDLYNPRTATKEDVIKLLQAAL